DIYIAGPKTEPTLCTWQHVANVTPGHGHITKQDGENGVWDAGAVSKQRIKGGDWEAITTVQEFYLAHDTFQRPNNRQLLDANMGYNWYDIPQDDDIIGNTLMIEYQRATPRLQTGKARLVLYCAAATCILRTHISLNYPGAHMIFR